MPLNHKDKKGLIAIAATLLAINLIIYLWPDTKKEPIEVIREQQPAAKNQQPTISSPKTQEKTEPFPFDPNTADSATFVRLGLEPRTAQSIIHYRQKGGVFRKKDDLSRIYTLSDTDFKRIKPYITIAPRYANHQTKQTIPALPQESTHTQPPYPKETNPLAKLRKGQSVELNAADTLELQKIPGIGAYYAKKIVRYRERLGGFISLTQLAEISHLPQGIETYVSLKPSVKTKIKINQLTFGQLLRHPYLNYEQVRAILNHRKNYGPIHTFTDLSTYTAFTSADFSRLRPYVDFSE